MSSYDQEAMRYSAKVRDPNRVFGGQRREGSGEQILEQPLFEERPEPKSGDAQPQPIEVQPGPNFDMPTGGSPEAAQPAASLCVQQPTTYPPTRAAATMGPQRAVEAHYNPQSSRFDDDPIPVPRITSVEVIHPAPRTAGRAMSPRRYAPLAYPIGAVSTIYRSPQQQRDDHRPRGVPTKLVSVPQTHTAVEVEQLREQLRQRDAEIMSLRSKCEGMSMQLHDKSKLCDALVERCQRDQTALRQALQLMQRQQAELMQLRHSLVTEVSDNDTLKNGFVNLIRKAQFELKSLRDELDYRDRKDRYARNIDNASVKDQ